MDCKTSRTLEDVGLYNKYEIQKNGIPVVGRYFVLKPDTDLAAAVALLAYAFATPNKVLAKDLLEWLQEIELTIQQATTSKS